MEFRKLTPRLQMDNEISPDIAGPWEFSGPFY